MLDTAGNELNIETAKISMSIGAKKLSLL